jgi:outer membrane lipoprotein carrier protein
MDALEKKMTCSRFWKHIIPIVFITAMCSFPAVHAQTVQEVVTTVENHYSELKDLSSKVVQKNMLKSIGKTQTFEGTLLIKKPGKLRLDYTNGQVILVDGKAALFYSKKSEQMIKKTFTDVEHMNIPVAFLLGAAHIRDDFDVLQPDPKAPRTLELLPRKPGAAMKKLGIETDDSGRIAVLVIFDKSGNTTDIRFSEIHEGVGLTDKQFAFTPPKGTEIIEQ